MIQQMEPKDTGTASRPSLSKRDFLAAGRTAMLPVVHLQAGQLPGRP